VHFLVALSVIACLGDIQIVDHDDELRFRDEISGTSIWRPKGRGKVFDCINNGSDV